MMVPKYHVPPPKLAGGREGIAPSRLSSDRSLLMHQVAIHRAALEAWRAGISVVPVLPGGGKRPAVAWRVYQHRLPTAEEIARWFGGKAYGLALITGVISGGLEALDFDSYAVYEAWSKQLQQMGFAALHDRLINGYLEATPNGMHLLYRSSPVERSQKLAAVAVDDSQRIHTLIETRGEGGLIIVAPSGGGVHPSGRPYRLLAGGIPTIATIRFEERQMLFSVARSFDHTPRHLPKSVQEQAAFSQRRGQRPGDCYNRRTSWAEVLEPHGWSVLYTREGVGYWQRPGKEGPGVSATTNYRGSDLLYVFSTSTVFEAGRTYSKFAAYAMLEHGGNFSAAARTLARRGYPENASVDG